MASGMSNKFGNEGDLNPGEGGASPRVRTGTDIQWLNGFTREAQIDHHWLKQFKNVEEFEPTWKGKIYYWY